MGARFSFIHCADLHLGARFRGISVTDPHRAEIMRRSVLDSFSRIVDHGIRENVDAMVIAGDAFDEDTITPSTRRFLSKELERFGKPVFMSKGNHDPVTDWESSIPMPPNVHVFGTEIERVPIPGVERAEVVGVSFRNWHDERNLPSQMSGTPGMFSIGCVHCDVDNPTAEYAYSPCSLSDMVGTGIDYWALGHIHKRSVLSESPWAVYPGNIQGRSFKETGEKGAMLVTVENGRVSSAEFFATQGMIWYDLTVDITGMDTMDQLVGSISGSVESGSMARVTVTGCGELDTMLRRDTEDIMRTISEETGCEISELRISSGPIVDLEARAGSKDMIGIVASTGLGLESADVSEIIAILRRNPVMKQYIEDFEQLDEKLLREMVREATMSLVSKMVVDR